MFKARLSREQISVSPTPLFAIPKGETQNHRTKRKKRVILNNDPDAGTDVKFGIYCL
jgi:hypothetical protein